RVVQIEVADVEFQLPARAYIRGRERFDDPLPCDRVDTVRADPSPDVKGGIGFQTQQPALMRETRLVGVEIFAFRRLPEVGAPAPAIVELGLEGLVEDWIGNGQRDADFGRKGSGAG